MSDLFDPKRTFGTLFQPTGTRRQKRGFQNLFATPSSNFTAQLTPPSPNTFGGGPGTGPVAPPETEPRGPTEINQQTAQNYQGTPFVLGDAINFRAFHESAQTGPKTSGGEPLGNITQHGMWRLDVSLSNSTWQWKWWAGDVSGLSRVYNSDIRPDATSPDDTFFGGTAPDDAGGAADDAEEEFRRLMQPYLDALNELIGQVPDAPDAQPFIDQINLLSERIGSPLTAEEQLDAMNQSAIAAGHWNLDQNGNVVADLAGYQAASARANDLSRVPQPGGVARTPLQQRQIRAQLQRDIGIAQKMFSDTGGESFGRAMSAVNEATAAIANADLQRQMAIDDQNFANAMLAFQAENDVLQAAISRGELTYREALDRRERGITELIDVELMKSGLMFQQYGAELAGIATRMNAITNAAMTAMAIEETAQAVWQAEYDKRMQPFWDAYNAMMADDAMNDPAISGEAWLNVGISLLVALPEIINLFQGLFGGGGGGGSGNRAGERVTDSQVFFPGQIGT